MKTLPGEIKLDLELADRESEAWDMDRVLGRQGSSVPEERAEAGVRLLWKGWDLLIFSLVLAGSGLKRQRRIVKISGRAGGRWGPWS